MTIQDWLGADNTLGIDIWNKKYRHENETFDAWLDRISGGSDRVKQLIIQKKFLFGGRILANRGRTEDGKRVTYSNCFSGDTKILTDTGIYRLDELVGKNVNVLSRRGSWEPAEIKSFGVQKVKTLTVSKSKAIKQIKVTGDHIWFVDDGKASFSEVSTDNLKPGMTLPTGQMKCYRKYKPSPFGVAHGFFSGDGDHTGNCRRVMFCGSKSDMIKYYMPDTVGGSGDVLSVSCIPKYFWDKPPLTETKSYLYGWLAGYFAADGSIDERGACTLASSKIEDLEYVKNVLCVLGIPSCDIRSQTRVSNLTNEESTIYILSLIPYYLNESFFVRESQRARFKGMNLPKKWKVVSVSDDTEEMEVFCAVVNGSQSFTIDGNILTHNCYVTSVDDSIESIYDACRKLARTFSYGGGVGLDISNLSPRGARINNAARETSGAVSFMDTFSQVTNTIGQHGRRAALMLSISCTHPDLEEFIHIKDDINRVNYANISVRITDSFMEAVRDNGQWELSFTRPETGETTSKFVNARDIFHSIAKGNWDMAEPGVLFWDRIEKWNLLSNTPNFKYAGVNPCAEEPLPDSGACMLSSINLSEFVDSNGNFNFDDFAEVVFDATIALNDVLDEGIPLHPLEEQRKTAQEWRQIGLGIFGLADMLIKMKLTYGSEEAIAMCKEISSYMINFSMLASATLAQRNGAYAHFDYDRVSTTPFYVSNVWSSTNSAVKNWGLRNSQLLTIAPTGTLSTMLGVSGGIEPIFAFSYNRKTQSLHGEDVTYKVYTKIAKQYMDAHSVKFEEDLPEYFITSQNVPYINRIKMQAAWQKSIDASISSTVNLQNNVTVEDVENIYMEAWKHGLKGITVYRDGCRRAGVLTTNTSKKDSDKDANAADAPQSDSGKLGRGVVISSSDNLIGKKRKLNVGCGSLHCVAFFDPETGALMETYLSKGSKGGCNNFMIGLSRMISLAARAGCGIHEIVDQLESCGTCPSYAVRRATKNDTSPGSCCPTAVGRALLDMYRETCDDIGSGCMDDGNLRWEKKSDSKAAASETAAPHSDKKCPQCGSSEIQFSGGCVSCPSCGWSRCD